MSDPAEAIELTLEELRAVTGFAAGWAEHVLPLQEARRPDEPRPREAVLVAKEFASGAGRGKTLRTAAFASYRCALDAEDPVVSNVAHAASAACGAAYLHPLAKATQVKHVLGSAAHAARALELDRADSGAADEVLERAAAEAGPVVRDVLRRYPPAPGGGGRVGELVRRLDAALRAG